MFSSFAVMGDCGCREWVNSVYGPSPSLGLWLWLVGRWLWFWLRREVRRRLVRVVVLWISWDQVFQGIGDDFRDVPLGEVRVVFPKRRKPSRHCRPIHPFLPPWQSVPMTLAAQRGTPGFSSPYLAMSPGDALSGFDALTSGVTPAVHDRCPLPFCDVEFCTLPCWTCIRRVR